MTSRKYLYEAKAAGGSVKSGHVIAETVADARERLALAGHTDVVVHDDDFLSDLRTAGEKQSGLAQFADLELVMRRDPSALALSLYVLRKSWPAVIVAAAAVGAAGWFGAPWWIWAVVLPMSAYLAYLLAFPGWMQWQQNEMHRAFWAADWDGAERIAQRLRGLKVVQALPNACLEIDARIASCRIGKGDLVGASALLVPWENDARVGKGLFLVKLNSLNFLARDWRATLAIQERILAEAGSDTAKIDLALMLARLGDDDARAAAMLDGIDPKCIVPIQAAFVAWARGVLALKRGNVERSLALLTEAVNGMQAIAANPLTWGAVGLATAYLSVAMARSGRRDGAAAMLACVRSIAERHGEDLLHGWLRTEKLIE